MIVKLIAVMTILFSVNALAETDSSWNGNFKEYIIFLPKSDHTSPISLTSTRINNYTQFDNNSVIDFSYFLSYQSKPSASAAWFFNPVEYRIIDLDAAPKLFDGNERFEQNLDRLSYSRYSDTGDFTIGRQAVSFGAGRMANPTDIFLPYPYIILDNEYRVGVDAIRYVHPFGTMSELDVGAVFGKDAKPENSSLFIATTLPIMEWDSTISYVFYRENSLIGFSTQGSIFGQGAWIEASYNLMSDDSTFFRSVLGLDYKINDDLTWFNEYQYNGAGTSNESMYIENASTSLAYAESGVFFLAENYLASGFTYFPDPLVNAYITIFYNIDDASAFSINKVEWNAGENHYLDATLYLGAGKSGSEYSSIENQVFLAYRFYY